MTLQRILAKTRRENILFSATVELTYRCNLACFFCYNDLELDGRPLTREQYFRFFEDLRDLQVLNLVLSGGEPLAHPDFLTLGAKARELGFVVRIKSNGHALRGTLARRVREEVDPFEIDLSLHGARAQTHDRQTQVAGSFDRLMANIPEMTELGLRLKLNCTLTRWNEDEVEEMLTIADRFGLRLNLNPTVSPRDDGDAQPLSIAPSREGRRRMLEVLAARLSRSGNEPQPRVGPLEDLEMPSGNGSAAEKNCGAGASSVTVDPFGNVLPCVQWRRPVGNLHRRGIREIWEGSGELEEVRELNAEARRVVAGFGARGSRMGFCPGLAEASSGDPLEVYDSAKEHLELLDEVERPASAAEKRELLPVIR